MMRRLLHGEVERKFAVGDKVIQTVNDYDPGVMNGTIGHVVAIESKPSGYSIDFDGAGARHIVDAQVQNVHLLGDRRGLRCAVKKNNTIRRRTFLSRWASEEVQP